MSRGRRPGIRKTLGDWEWNSTILWNNIVETDVDSCWSWLGSVGPQTNLFGGRKSGVAQMTQARRILYREVFNEDCDDKQIKHSCGNSFCMNWHHFEVRPNQHKFRLDGTDRHQPKADKPRAYLPRAKIVEVATNRRWWNE